MLFDIIQEVMKRDIEWLQMVESVKFSHGTSKLKGA